MHRLSLFARLSIFRLDGILRNHGAVTNVYVSGDEAFSAKMHRGKRHLFIGHSLADGEDRAYTFVHLSQDVARREYATLMLWQFEDDQSWWLEFSNDVEFSTYKLARAGKEHPIIGRIWTTWLRGHAKATIEGMPVTAAEAETLVADMATYYATGAFPAAAT